MGQPIGLHNEKVLAKLEEGDLVKFPRGFFSHWGVYVGDGEMVHLTGVGISGTAVDASLSNVFTISGIRYKKACVKKDKFLEVAGQRKAEKKNNKDGIKQPLDRGEIKTRALMKLGPISYSLWSDNCEHFAKWCRYDIHHSDQVDAVLEGGVIAGTIIAVLGMLAGIRLYIRRFFNNRK